MPKFGKNESYPDHSQTCNWFFNEDWVNRKYYRDSSDYAHISPQCNLHWWPRK